MSSGDESSARTKIAEEISRGNTKGALELLDVALRAENLESDETTSLSAVKGLVALLEGDTETALSVLGAASRDRAGNANIHYLLGEVLRSKNQLKEAADQFVATLALDPDHQAALARLSTLRPWQTTTFGPPRPPKSSDPEKSKVALVERVLERHQTLPESHETETIWNLRVRLLEDGDLSDHVTSIGIRGVEIDGSVVPGDWVEFVASALDSDLHVHYSSSLWNLSTDERVIAYSVGNRGERALAYASPAVREKNAKAWWVERVIERREVTDTGRPQLVWDIRLRRWELEGSVPIRAFSAAISMKGDGFTGSVFPGDWVRIDNHFVGELPYQAEWMTNLTTDQQVRPIVYSTPDELWSPITELWDRGEKATAILHARSLVATKPHGLLFYWLAELESAAGEGEQAVEHLRQAVDRLEPLKSAAAGDSWFDPIRDEPAFKQLVPQFAPHATPDAGLESTDGWPDQPDDRGRLTRMAAPRPSAAWFDVLVTSYRGRKINVLRTAYEITGMNERTVEHLIDSSRPIQEALDKVHADEVKNRLEQAGAKVELRASSRR